MEEIWKSIQNYENLYEISNLGRIKSLHTTGNVRNVIFLKFPLNRKGYPMAILHKNSKVKSFILHLLVWDYFGNEPRDGVRKVVDHINENKLDAQINNLQLLSNRKNNIKSRQGKRSLSVGVRFYNKRTDKYTARIWKGKEILLGIFNCPTAASLAYERALSEIQ